MTSSGRERSEAERRGGADQGARSSGQAGCRRKWPGIYVVGLTGGIASGKSTVSEMLAGLGAQIIDADRLARETTLPGAEGFRKVREAFGDDIMAPDGTLDRRRLAEVVFRNAAARARLNSIIHPLVLERILRLLREIQEDAQAKGSPRVVIVDAPLLFEAGADAVCDETWVIAAGPEDQIERLRKRNGYTREEALFRIDSQMPLAEKERRATRVIDNRGAIDETRHAVLKVWNDLTRVSRECPPEGSQRA